MAVSDRRQRQFEQREADLLAIAQSVVADHGCHALSIDKVAARFEYSRATVYLHFDNKADVLTALAAKALEHQFGACERALLQPWRTRERLLSILVIHAESIRLRPHLIGVNQLLYDRRLIDEANPARREELAKQRARAYALAEALVREAWSCGDLTPPPRPEPAAVLLPVWSLIVGGGTILADPAGVWRSRLGDPHPVLLQGFHDLLDGMSWRPLSDDWDYHASAARILGLVRSESLLEGWNSGPGDPNS